MVYFTPVFFGRVSAAMRLTEKYTLRLVCTVINRMTLDLRAFSRTGGWFAAARTTAVPGSGERTATDNNNGVYFYHTDARTGDKCDGDDCNDDVDYVVSELTLTRTLRAEDGFDMDIELGSTQLRKPSHTSEDGRVRVDVHVQYT